MQNPPIGGFCLPCYFTLILFSPIRRLFDSETAILHFSEAALPKQYLFPVLATDIFSFVSSEWVLPKKGLFSGTASLDFACADSKALDDSLCCLPLNGGFALTLLLAANFSSLVHLTPIGESAFGCLLKTISDSIHISI